MENSREHLAKAGCFSVGRRDEVLRKQKVEKKKRKHTKA